MSQKVLGRHPKRGGKAVTLRGGPIKTSIKNCRSEVTNAAQQIHIYLRKILTDVFHQRTN